MTKSNTLLLRYDDITREQITGMMAFDGYQNTSEWLRALIAREYARRGNTLVSRATVASVSELTPPFDGDDLPLVVVE